MSITIVLSDGKTLHITEATASHMKQLRETIAQGRGAIEFTLDNRLYMINVANVLYAEVTPATGL